MGILRAPTAAIANLGVTSRSETLWGLLDMLRSLSGWAWAGLGWVWLQQREEGRKKSRWKYFVQTFRAETKTWTLRPKNLLPDKFCFLHIERQNLIKINPHYSAWVIRKYLFFCIFDTFISSWVFCVDSCPIIGGKTVLIWDRWEQFRHRHR